LTPSEFYYFQYDQSKLIILKPGPLGGKVVLCYFLQAGKGGELTHDETTIIQGALDLTAKVKFHFPTPQVTAENGRLITT